MRDAQCARLVPLLPPNLEGAHVAVKESELVLALKQPDEVAARAQQPERQQQNLAPLAGQIAPDLKEVDMHVLGRAVDQRHIDLGPPPALLAQVG